MSTAKHTPGPWTALANVIVTVGIPGNGALATIRETPCEGGLNLSRDIAEANARLIAAAPDLLAALRECITEDGALAWRNAEFAGRRLEAISNIARAAIKKAEGEL